MVYTPPSLETIGLTVGFNMLYHITLGWYPKSSMHHVNTFSIVPAPNLFHFCALWNTGLRLIFMATSTMFQTPNLVWEMAPGWTWEVSSGRHDIYWWWLLTMSYWWLLMTIDWCFQSVPNTWNSSAIGNQHNQTNTQGQKCLKPPVLIHCKWAIQGP